LHPTIYHAKNLIKQLNEDKGVVFFCDLHGHSRAHGAFVYGCKSSEVPESTRIYPYILSKINPYFFFESSKFGIQSSRAKTARVVVYRELETIPAIYTLESSFSGTLDGTFYTPDLLKSIGRDVCRALIPYCELSVPFHIKTKTKTPNDNKE